MFPKIPKNLSLFYSEMNVLEMAEIELLANPAAVIDNRVESERLLISLPNEATLMKLKKLVLRFSDFIPSDDKLCKKLSRILNYVFANDYRPESLNENEISPLQGRLFGYLTKITNVT